MKINANFSTFLNKICSTSCVSMTTYYYDDVPDDEQMIKGLVDYRYKDGEQTYHRVALVQHIITSHHCFLLNTITSLPITELSTLVDRY